MRQLPFFLVLSVVLSFATQGWSEDIRQASGAPIHEAFISPITGPVALDAYRTEPPRSITERIPGKAEGDQLWIPGYWSWSAAENDFIWVTGVWRSPPPGRTWTPGYWKSLDEGWVWLRGFWSDQPVEQFEPLAVNPPDPKEEVVETAPDLNHFWAPGYWLYNQSKSRYEWVEGTWESFDPHWVYVPATYVWRPDGWLFISSYWDWPADDMGRAYAGIWIPANLRADYTYTPMWVLRPEIITQTCYGAYPNYLYWCHHHWHYNPQFWASCDCAPTWWHWQEGWTMPWHDQWAVWWWWSHPGYPHPAWLTKHASDLIAPAKQTVFDWVKKTTPPAIVLPNGVVSSQHLQKALDQISPGKEGQPILPSNKKTLQQVQNKALTKTIVPHNVLKPEGKSGDWQNAPAVIKKNPLPLAQEEGEQFRGPKIQLPRKNLLPVVAPKGPQPAIPIIQTNPTPVESVQSNKERPIYQQEPLQNLQKYHQLKEEQLQQHHAEQLRQIRFQHQDEVDQLQQRNAQRMQLLQQQHADQLQQVQAQQFAEQTRQQVTHQQKMEFQQDYLKQVQEQQQQLQQRHQQIDDHQQKIAALEQYKTQQEQEREERIKKLQSFRQPQSVPQTPYKHESNGSHR